MWIVDFSGPGDDIKKKNSKVKIVFKYTHDKWIAKLEYQQTCNLM